MRQYVSLCFGTNKASKVRTLSQPSWLMLELAQHVMIDDRQYREVRYLELELAQHPRIDDRQ